jgi:hypothetical protein
MGEPEGVSLGKLGLVAVDGLDCPEGGLHHVLEPELIIAAGAGRGAPLCQKCREQVHLISARELA